jgi:hypothetical protein
MLDMSEWLVVGVFVAAMAVCALLTLYHRK